ncbi:MAG: hypothetical protein RR263_02175, partial [Oscillospiraceae bacterium]
SPGEFGNAMKVGAMRLRGQKGELEAMGEDVDGVIEGVSKIQTQIANLTNGKVNIFEDDNETLKSTYEIYTEIGKVYNTMSDKDQASITEILFGKQRGSAGSALLLNIEEATKVYQDSLNAAGSMDEEFAKHQESAEAAVIRLQESIIGLSSNVISGDLVKNLANTGAGVITFADNVHLLELALRAAMGVGIAKFALNTSKTFIQVSGSVKKFSNAMNLLNQAKKTGINDAILQNLGQATKDLTDDQLKLFMSSNLLDDKMKKQIITNQGLIGKKKTAKLATLGLDAATKAETASTVAATTATFSLKGAMLGLGATIKSVFLSNPIGWAIIGISTAVSVLSAVTDGAKHKTEEYRQKALDAANTANEQSRSIAELTTKYIALSETVNLDENSKAELLSLQGQLMQNFKLEGQTIEELTIKYGNLTEAIKAKSIEALKASQNDLTAGIIASENNLLDAGSGGFIESKNVINASGDNAIAAFKALERAKMISSGSFGSSGGVFTLTGDDNTVNGILENYNNLGNALEVLQNSFSTTELENNSLYVAMLERYKEIQPSVDEYNLSIENLNQNLANQEILNSLRGKEIPKTKEAFDVWSKSVIDSAKDNEDFIGSVSDIENAVIMLLSKAPEFQEFVDITKMLASAPIVPQTPTDVITAFTIIEETLSSVSTAFGEVTDKGNLSAKTLSELSKSFGTLSTFDGFINVLGNVNSTTSDITNALKAMVIEYVSTSSVLQNV